MGQGGSPRIAEGPGASVMRAFWGSLHAEQSPAEPLLFDGFERAYVSGWAKGPDSPQKRLRAGHRLVSDPEILAITPVGLALRLAARQFLDLLLV